MTKGRETMQAHRQTLDTPAPRPVAAEAPALEARGLSIALGAGVMATPVVHDVSFSLRRGEILGLVGESGAGKSLIGAALTGIMRDPARVSGGAVLLDGGRIDQLSGRALRAVRGRRIGTIFQDPLTSLNPLMTIGAQLVETIRSHKAMTRRAARARAVALLEEVGIPDAPVRQGQYPHQFSGGMRQRAVIALALCADPDVIVADEPTTALDVSVQAQILELLVALCRGRGMAMILITHDMGVISRVADRVAVLYAGRIAELGGAREVMHAPMHPYTRGLMRCIPRIGVMAETLPQIEGAMPRPGELPPGCAFAPRCRSAGSDCSAAPPPLRDADGRTVACLHPLPRGPQPGTEALS